MPAASSPEIRRGRDWPRPRPWLQLPQHTAGVQQPVLTLNGTWKFHPRPPADFWRPQSGKAAWTELPVPSCTFAHGFDIQDGDEYACHRMVSIPADFAGQRIFLRFDGVAGRARVWIDGHYVRQHYGGFTTWYCDITDRVTPGQDSDLTVAVQDVQAEVSVFNLGGIIRDVWLVAVPPVHLAYCHVACTPAPDFAAATLAVRISLAGQSVHAHRLQVHVRDPQGHPVALETRTWDVPATAQDDFRFACTLPDPVLWDAEHPRLYELELRLLSGTEVTEIVTQCFGVRSLAVDGRRLLVNGREVKLRGVNRHDVHLLTGRTVTPAQVEADVKLFHEANVNFIRTSHYPPREDFLDCCDRWGIYVEVETAVAFVYQSIRPTQNDPAFTAAYMEQFAEMMERDRNHPCVIMWSLANECCWGSNFQHQYEYARREDPDRPLIFSYPNTMPEGTPPCDIWSQHYAAWNQDPGLQTDTWSGHGPRTGMMPVLHDEYAHIACYNLGEQRRDPAVREFWGKSIKCWWERIFTTHGALGGAIWGGIDDEMITSAGYTGQREWGIIDGWRRRKPEHWLTKKAYSPVRLQDWQLPLPQDDGKVHIPLANWFDHTNLDELTVRWQAGDATGAFQGPSIAPHTQGQLVLPPEVTRHSGPVRLSFVRSPDLVVDVYELTPAPARDTPGPDIPLPAPRLAADADRYCIQHPDFTLTVSRTTGMMSTACGDETVIVEGPFLSLTGMPLPPWTARHVDAQAEDDAVLVQIAGAYGDIEVTFDIRVRASGTMDIAYRIDHLPWPSPRARALRAGRDAGGFREIGIAFDLTGRVDRVSWERRGLWSVYPEDHIGRNRGTAVRERTGGDESYRREPAWPWAYDMRSYSLYGRYDVGGRGTHDFRAMKHNIREASALVDGSPARFTALSDGRDAVRLEVLAPPGNAVPVTDPAVQLQGAWIPALPDTEREWISNRQGDCAEIRFTGTGICWLGARDMISGKACVYLDGEWMACIDLYPGIGHGTARGEVKAEDEILFSREDLPAGAHTLRIEVLDKHHPDASNSYVSVSGFRILGPHAPGNVRFHILSAWNYPELTWGNYMKEPILAGSGYARRITARIHRA